MCDLICYVTTCCVWRCDTGQISVDFEHCATACCISANNGPTDAAHCPCSLQDIVMQLIQRLRAVVRAIFDRMRRSAERRALAWEPDVLMQPEYNVCVTCRRPVIPTTDTNTPVYLTVRTAVHSGKLFCQRITCTYRLIDCFGRSILVYRFNT